MKSTGVSLSEKFAHNPRALVFTIGRYAIVLAAFVPLAITAHGNWAEIRAALREMDLLLLTGAVLVNLAVSSITPWISWFSLRNLGYGLPYKKAFGLYFLSQMPKYLPGGIWAFPSRVLAYQWHGVPQAQAAVSVLREVGALFLGAALVGCLTLFVGIPIADPVRIAIAIGVLGVIVLILLTQIKLTWRFLEYLRLSKFIRLPVHLQGEQKQVINLAWIPGTLACSLVFWLALGFPFHLLASAVSVEAARLNWIESASIFALAWSAGFVVFLVPAGLGVRESALAFLLSRVVPPGDALSIALIARLWWMAVEAVLIVFSVLFLGSKAGLAPAQTKR